MEQMALFDEKNHWTVTELTRHLRQLLDGDPDLQGIWVQGEISNLSRPSSGHMYFTLKDSGAALRCVMWKGDVSRLGFTLQDGTAIEAHGNLGIYEVAGQYQLYADSLRPLGEGALYQEFLRLKTLLEAEGLFDGTRKRPIPVSPRRIGIVTSPTGAALLDILNTLQRRMPLAEVILAPTPVQGEDAPQALVLAILTLNRVAAPDVILLARGGGSIEDLWAFNDERVVRAVAGSQAPVITGVGHETDITLVDFAADLRAPTPTAAAELATAITVLDLRQKLVEAEQFLAGSMAALIVRQRTLIEGFLNGLRFYSPLRRIFSDKQQVDELNRRTNAAQNHRLELASTWLKGLDNRLSALSPLAVLERGYALVMKERLVVSSTTQVEAGDGLHIRLRDGEFDARVSGKG
jgi:exodeoxyribonuclease VII large subunit